VCDVGVSYNNYSADITRTFPIENKFSKRQKDVYNEVLKCQKAIISMIKPGVAMKTLNEKTIELISKSLIKLGLIKDKKDYKKYYMHSVGHQLGMDTHDIGPRDIVLKPGMVTTVEPGIYIPEESIGVRIEDDVLVTKTGCEVLSAMIPKEIDELEKIRSSRK
jgi:Xaa-Pro aminopeptidase